MKIKKTLTESVKKAYIDQSGSLARAKDKLEAIATADGCTDFYYFDSVKFTEPLSAAEAGENIIVYTDGDCKVNCPELAKFKNVTICDITDKIKNEALTEAEEPSDEDNIIDDVLSASVSEIADAVQAAAEDASEGEETYSDAKAEKVATQIKTWAEGFETAAWAPLDVRSDLTDALDDCLAASFESKTLGTHDGTDLLVSGLPGSGKTGITKQWAKDRGVNLFYLNAKNDDLGAILNGFPVDTTEETEDGRTVHAVARSFSKSLDDLDKERSVLFLDEFNRAPSKLRAVLLSLINEHVIDGNGPDGYRHFDHLLFTVACINPAVPTDPGAMELNDAEMSRFVDTLDWDSTPSEAVKYINWYIPEKVIKNIPQGKDYNALYIRAMKRLNLANALLNDYRFNFDTRKDLKALFYNADEDGNPDQAKMLNQRSITDAIMKHGHDKNKFLAWVDRKSKFLEKNKEMIHEILDSWVEPEVTLPGAETDAATTAAAEKPQTSKAFDPDSEDFETAFGAGGEETDVDLFGNTASQAGNAAKVSAADALSRIKGFDFTL